MSEIIFVSGIHTDAGKSYATGWWARRMMDAGLGVITQKFIQTGNTDYSEDIVVHRRIMDVPMFPEDIDHTTAPVIFSYPASPQLAARIDGREIDLSVVDRSLKLLSGRFDVVLLEGAGGLMVPLTDDTLTIDYVTSRRMPLALVTNGSLGSINHTLLSLEAIKNRNIELRALLYNTHFDTDAEIAADTRGYIGRYMAREFPGVEILDVPSVKFKKS
ncbi:MAG: dethiobiotin synthase [Pseudoflavonifractor sp.]|nr:dethiobiotin synthase [Pseudoflavonifractor sp.]